MSGKLTAKQEALLAEIPQELRRETALAYIENGYENKKQAYLSACKKMGRSSSKNPETSASEILNYANVTDFINSVKAAAAESVQVNAEYVLRRLKQIDELDIIDIMMGDLSAFKPLSQWPKEWRISISGIDLNTIVSGDDMETIVKKIKWPDKTKNLELIGRHVQVRAWEKEVEVSSVTNNIMPVPTCDSADDWEKAAQAQQAESLKNV